MDQKDLAMLRDILEEAGVPQNKVSDFLSVYQPSKSEAEDKEPIKTPKQWQDLEMQIANTNDWRVKASLVAKKISWGLTDYT